MPTRVPHSGPDPPRFECAGSAPAVPSTSGTGALPAVSASALPWRCLPLPPELHAAVGPLLRSYGIAPESVEAGGAMLLVVPTSAASSPDDLAHALARACDTRTIVDEIRTVVLDRARQSQDLREENAELQKENEKLHDMHAHGLLDFASAVDPEDFHAFAVVMALGNRNAAAEYLKAGRGTFYDRIARWESLGPGYQRMLRLLSWRKRVGRKIKLTLPDLDAAGSSGHTAANPGVLEEVLASISESESHDYPAVLRDVLRLVLLQGPENWKALRAELLALLRDELPE